MGEIELKRIIIIEEGYSGKSAVPFWENLNGGDVVLITTMSGRLSRSYAQTFKLVNMRTGSEIFTGGGDLSNKFRKIKWRYDAS